MDVPFSDLNHNQIFFLVSPPAKNSVRVMSYRTFAWPVHSQNRALKYKKDALRIISGEIHFTTKCNETIDKIVRASLLHREQADHGITMKLVI